MPMWQNTKANKMLRVCKSSFACSSSSRRFSRNSDTWLKITLSQIPPGIFTIVWSELLSEVILFHLWATALIIKMGGRNIFRGNQWFLTLANLLKKLKRKSATFFLKTLAYFWTVGPIYRHLPTLLEFSFVFPIKKMAINLVLPYLFFLLFLMKLSLRRATTLN